MATDITLERSLPHNLDAERSVLGAIMIDNQAYNAAVEILRPEDFFLDSHRRVFSKMIQLQESAKPVDLVTLAEELGRSQELESVGGAAYLSSLVDGVPRVMNVPHYARIVKEKSILRGLIAASNSIITQAIEADEEADAILDRAESAIFALAEERVKAGFLGVKEIVKSSFKTIDALYERGHITGLATGYGDFDALTRGLQSGELIVLAARPSMGKTALALNIAEHTAIHLGQTVGLFSLEMARESLVLRMLCSEARVNPHKLAAGYLAHEDYGRMTMALGRLAEAPIFIDDTPALTVMEMRAKARRLKAEHSLGLLIVDYMQLMSGRGRFENRTQEMSSISRGLKALAKELRIPLVAISQLSRAPETRGGDHRPQLSDLRESGSIEQDADLVAFIYRSEMYYRDPTEVPEDERGRAELIVSKQRNGPIGKVQLAFMKEFTRFENLFRE